MVPSDICSLYSKSQLSNEVLSLLIQSLPEDLDIDWTYSLLSNLPKSMSFSLTTMFLNKSEKEALKQIIKKLTSDGQTLNNLYKAYRINP